MTLARIHPAATAPSFQGCPWAFLDAFLAMIFRNMPIEVGGRAWLLLPPGWDAQGEWVDGLTVTVIWKDQNHAIVVNREGRELWISLENVDAGYEFKIASGWRPEDDPEILDLIEADVQRMRVPTTSFIVSKARDGLLSIYDRILRRNARFSLNK